MIKDNINNEKSNFLKIPIDLFIDNNNQVVNDMKCCLCLFVPLEPIVIKTGKEKQNHIIICKDCFTNFNYNENSLNIIGIDKKSSLSLKTLVEHRNIKCINNHLGCNWIGEYRYLETHLINECPFQEVKCIHEECDKIILRKDLIYHLTLCDFTRKRIRAKCNDCMEEFDIYIGYSSTFARVFRKIY